jgi:putative endonuclease
MQNNHRFCVYILQCADDTLYTGWTTNPARRLKSHNGGMGAKYTRSRLPVRMVYCEHCADENDARRRECAVKAMTRTAKLKLIEENPYEDDIVECERSACVPD